MSAGKTSSSAEIDALFGQPGGDAGGVIRRRIIRARPARANAALRRQRRARIGGALENA